MTSAGERESHTHTGHTNGHITKVAFLRKVNDTIQPRVKKNSSTVSSKKHKIIGIDGPQRSAAVQCVTTPASVIFRIQRPELLFPDTRGLCLVSINRPIVLHPEIQLLILSQLFPRSSTASIKNQS